MSRWFERHPRTTLIAAALILLVALLALLEISVRLAFPRVNFLGVERGIFTPLRDGSTYGNRPGFRGVAFGERVTIDALGFRLDTTGARAFDPARESILFLGDSVTFGVGTPDGATFVDLVARTQPYVNTLNGGVIGYALEDYEAAVAALIGADNPLRIRHVFLGLCLNDLSPSSKAEILAEVAGAHEPAPPPAESALARIAHPVNDALRDRSKLFLFMKSLVLDTGRGYFLADRALYDDTATVKAKLAKVSMLRDRLAERGIGLTVLLFPYEFQVRNATNAAVWMPQRRIEAELTAAGIPYLDLASPLLTDMRSHERASKDYFLFNDPMHLAPLGHRLIAESIAQSSPRTAPALRPDATR